MPITIKKAIFSDAHYLLELANDSLTRSNSFNSEKISWENHLKWFNKKLNDEQSHMYIFSKNTQKIGTAKIEICDTETIIGLTIDPKYRGKGFASRIITMACLEFWKTNDNEINAYIKTNNIGSIKSFTRASFKLEADMQINEEDCVKLIAKK